MWDNFIKLAEAFGEDKGYEKSIQILKNLEDLEVAILIVFLLTVILIYQIFQCYKKKKKSSEEQNKDKEEKKSSLLKYFDTCTQKLEGKAKDNLKIKGAVLDN
ncbi:hypothetical protein J2T38_001298 [Neisseria perflava]|uniref:hypothetical protein n=1 Tax=Neisseria perflava TaxID=33053 RepID=UPI00209FBF2A|nr:hypothetical protein [Neisseria perflava]MCP1772470.1 hypothetical protein [Neisseria perflava]